MGLSGFRRADDGDVLSFKKVETWQQFRLVEDSVLSALQKTAWFDGRRAKSGAVSDV